MRILSLLKWFLLAAVLIVIGAKLIDYGSEQESKFMRGYELYDSAVKALEEGNIETAYTLFIQSSYEFQDPNEKAVALYGAATVGWVGGIADYDTLVGLYQQALRYKPGFDEAAFDLEYLYWLKANAKELPAPEPGTEPSREEEPSSGDV